MRSYEAARSLFSFLAFIAWCVIILGVLAALLAGGVAGNARSFGGGPTVFLAILPGIGIAIVGFVCLALVQIGRATVDTAELTQQMLEIARDRLEISRNALSSAGMPANTFENLTLSEKTDSSISFRERSSEAESATLLRAEDRDGITTFNGQKIKRVGATFVVDGLPFFTMEDAKAYILENPKPETERL
ncbi:hypothetical protein M4578_25350 [Salipiger sp. P9]|uniref:hypothetical protein n=1 Tax=Salipiger pentaromativorans TaxID=2943193 RepID=UPI0021589748|nr:hypothetical protein [Salipiger pentaromativorans]MCR8551156.1 hypothetical protein [Salipiger pentaromativorans]